MARVSTTQTTIYSKSYWHIVLVVHHRRRLSVPIGQYGSLGVSRRAELGYRPCEYNSLFDLALSFIQCYNSLGHTVRRITVGLPFSHDLFSKDPIHWITLNVCFLLSSFFFCFNIFFKSNTFSKYSNNPSGYRSLCLQNRQKPRVLKSLKNLLKHHLTRYFLTVLKHLKIVPNAICVF